MSDHWIRRVTVVAALLTLSLWLLIYWWDSL